MTVPALIRTPATPVWVLLMAATVLSVAVGGAHGTTVLVLAVAFVKVRFIGLYFMELRDAPPLLRLAFEGWCLLIGTLVIVMYLVRG
ncbi:MAG TPA: cytochrome C oxidase subunit IV family protein [Solirubrobacteraceae bacterium]